MAMDYIPPSRIKKLKESATIKAAEKARELEAKGVKVIHLDVGEPDFSTPKPVIDAAYKAMKEGYTHYASSQGLPELREAISDHVAKRFGVQVSENEILVTPGAKQSIFYALSALLDEGDEVLIPTPAWVSYMEMTKLAGGVPVEVGTKANFFPDLDGLRSKLTKRTKVLMLNYPNNPTGAVYDEEILKELADFVEANDLWVISDEIYERLTYRGMFISFASIDGMQGRTITVNGFSKAYAMTGWRLGYAYGPEPVIKAMVKLQQHTATCVPPFAQKAAVVALTECESFIEAMVREFKERRDLMVEGLKRLGIKVTEPHGAFYVFPDVSDVYSEPQKFAEFLLEKAAVSVTPGAAFGSGYEAHVRVSYANSKENIREALERMERVLHS